MAKIPRLFPFGFWPANWGLEGSRKATAYAEYYYEGEELAYKLLEIQYPEQADKEYRSAKLKLDYKYHKVGEFDYGLGLIENDTKLTEVDRQREMSKYLAKFGKITPEELEYRLFELSYAVKDTEAYQKEKLKLDVRFNKKTEEQADHELLDMQFTDKDDVKYQIEKIKLDRKYGKLDQNAFEKQEATLLKEPWFNWIGSDQKITGDNVQLAIELDWNEYFITFLEQQGWSGVTPDEIVDKWVEEMMRQQLNVDAAGDPLDDGTADPMPLASTTRTRRDDGLTEYQ
jgi:hypothetical protein